MSGLIGVPAMQLDSRERTIGVPACLTDFAGPGPASNETHRKDPVMVAMDINHQYSILSQDTCLFVRIASVPSVWKWNYG